jgi:hypothetical protein
MPFEARLLNPSSPAEARNSVLEGRRLLSTYRRFWMGIRLKNVSLPHELEQDTQTAFQEFRRSDPSAGDYIDKMQALEQIVEDLELYENKIEASHLVGTVQVSPMTPQPPGRSLADARPDGALSGSSAGLETDGSDGSSASQNSRGNGSRRTECNEGDAIAGPRKRGRDSRDSSLFLIS